MSVVRTACLASALLLAGALPAAAAIAFESGGWVGEANRDETGKFTDCTMTAGYENGITLAFIISRDHAWGLVLANEKWNLKVGAVHDVSLAVDARPPIRTVAKVVDPRGILMPLAKQDKVMEAMRHGRTLSIVTPSGDVSFKLTGTREAIAALSRCVDENLKSDKASGRSAALSQVRRKPDGGEERSNRLFTAGEAKMFATNLLSSAGFRDFQVFDSANNPMPNFDVVWTYRDGIVGALAGYRDLETGDLDEVASMVMADDAKNCKGDFVSGKKRSDSTVPVQLKRLFTACRGDDNPVEIHYTLVRTESGHLIQIAHLNLGNSVGDAAATDSALMRDAVLEQLKRE